MREPTQEYLRECFDYVNGKLYWKERPREHFNSDQSFKRWHTMYCGIEAGWDHYYKSDQSIRRDIGLGGVSYKRSRLVWIYFKGEIKKGNDIDHEDGNTLNDKIENLRSVTRKQNCCNRRLSKSNTSGHYGVYFDSWKNRWVASGFDGGKRIHLYQGVDKIKAIEARQRWELNHPHITKRHGK